MVRIELASTTTQPQLQRQSVARLVDIREPQVSASNSLMVLLCELIVSETKGWACTTPTCQRERVMLATWGISALFGPGEEPAEEETSESKRDNKAAKSDPDGQTSPNTRQTWLERNLMSPAALMTVTATHLCGSAQASVV